MKIEFIKKEQYSNKCDCYINNKYIGAINPMHEYGEIIKSKVFESSFLIIDEWLNYHVYLDMYNTNAMSYIYNKFIQNPIILPKRQIRLFYNNMFRLDDVLYIIPNNALCPIKINNVRTVLKMYSISKFKIQHEPLAIFSTRKSDLRYIATKNYAYKGSRSSSYYPVLSNIVADNFYYEVALTNDNVIILDSQFNEISKFNNYISYSFITDNWYLPNNTFYVKDSIFTIYKDFKPIFQTKYEPIQRFGIFINPNSPYIVTDSMIYKNGIPLHLVASELYIHSADTELHACFKNSKGIFELINDVPVPLGIDGTVLYYDTNWKLIQTNYNSKRFVLISKKEQREFVDIHDITDDIFVLKSENGIKSIIYKDTGDTYDFKYITQNGDNYFLCGDSHLKVNKVLDVKNKKFLRFKQEIQLKQDYPSYTVENNIITFSSGETYELYRT